MNADMTRRRALAAELSLLTLLAAALGALIPLSAGHFAWSWDALNHHIYLGMTAESRRWDLDVFAASSQTYQYPFLYWPVYRLSFMSGSGAWLGALWSSSLAVMLLLPVWCVSLRLLRGEEGVWLPALQRAAACALAFMNAVVLIGLETTASDMLAAVPLLWAVAVGLSPRATQSQALMASALWGVSVACKLSNGLFLPLLLFWWWQREPPYFRWQRGAALALGACLGFGLPYSPWGLALWQQTGNPFYPLLGQFFGGH